MGRAPHPASDVEADGRIVRESMEAAEVESFAGRDVTTLSGGELARAVFARVLAQQTPVLLLDEPTAPLDLRHQEAVMAKARALARQGACVLVVLHDLSLAARYCDKVAMFAGGHLVSFGEPEEVLTAERIGEVYGQEVLVLRHPHTGRPLVVPV
jgi:iron complex transport system ATP-binding protein